MRNYVCNNTDTVVNTPKGKIRGFKLDGIYNFEGIKYANAKRWQMPEEVPAWEGIKDALAYGYVCPLQNQDNPTNEQLVPHRYWPQDENCQSLNIWTKQINTDAKKPVLVWFHGGGFAAGSSIEQVAYDGQAMCENGDVVVVTVNHRLNILGYFDMSPFGEKYKNSGNVGTADMVASLQWVHDNIAAFGGDPENVTIFGQSGGGAKVWVLMNTPAADGLFQKGVVQSGLLDVQGRRFFDVAPGDGKEIVLAVLKELGLTESDVDKLETMPYRDLAAAYGKVMMPLAMQGKYVGGNPQPGEYYKGDPRSVGFTDHAKTIPVMIGTVFGEFAFGPTQPGRHTMSDEEATKIIRDKFGDATDEMIPLYKKAYPDKPLVDLAVLDSWFRLPSMDFIDKKSYHHEAPTYSYLFAYEFPYEEGKPAWHCSEIPFVFHNTDLVPVCCKEGVSDKLEANVFGAWISFAKTGKPGHAGLPDWPACVDGDEATMIFDEKCEVRHNHDHALIPLVDKNAKPFEFGKQKIEH
jgi:para-nitrobenzyl esterase